MRNLALLVGLCVGAASCGVFGFEPTDNPAIDIAGYLRVAGEAAQREARRVSEAEFMRLSREKYDELHIRGAINLSFADIASASLEATLLDRNARILIYCNNNFENAPGPFPSKLPSAALNLSTYIALYDYGYRNVYELGPLIDIRATDLEFESSPRP